MFSKTEDNALKVAEMHKISINKKFANLTCFYPIFSHNFPSLSIKLYLQKIVFKFSIPLDL